MRSAFADPGWVKAALLPPSLPTSAYVVCVADGAVKTHTAAWGVARSVWVPAGNGLYLWRAFASPADFIEFTKLDGVRALRVTYLEAVVGATRLVLELQCASESATDDGLALSASGLHTKECFFSRAVVGFLAALGPALGRPQPFTLDDFEVVDASEGADFAFRLVAKRAVLRSKRACDALFARLAGLTEWRPVLRVADFITFGATVRMVKSQCAVENGAHLPALRPLSPAGVSRLLSGARFVGRDFHESAQPSFYTDTCYQPLSEAEVRLYSVSAATVAAPEPLDALFAADACVAAPRPPWLVACEVKLLRALPHLAPVLQQPPDRHADGEQESFVEFDVQARWACPAGVTHAGGWGLRLGVDADGGLSATCCAPPRGTAADLFLLDGKGQRVLDAAGVSVSVSCHARDDCCCRLQLGDVPVDDLFLPATRIPAVADGIGTLRLPALTREVRGRIQLSLDKPYLKCWVFVNPCGSGKTFSYFHAPLVEHVAMLEAAERRVYVVVACPTRKLVRDAVRDIDIELVKAGLTTRCKRYDVAELCAEVCAGGVFVTCIHSLHLFNRFPYTVQLLFVDEVGEGTLSCASTQPRSSLADAAAVVRDAEEVIMADAFAGAETLDFLAMASIEDNRFHVFDTPEVRPFRDQKVRLVIPVAAKTAAVQPSAAVAKAVQLAAAGKRVLFVAGTVEEVEVLRRSCEAADLRVRVMHSRLTAASNTLFEAEFAKEAGATTVQVFGISPILTSGVNSWRLFDCVVAALQTQSISMAVYLQMVSRPRDKGTEIYFYAGEQALVTAAAGGWHADRVDYDAASPEVQASLQGRRLVGVSTLEGALEMLALATLRANLVGGDAPLTVATDGDAARRLAGDALFVKGKGKAGWFRLVQSSPRPMARLESFMHKQDEARRLAVAARAARAQAASAGKGSTPLIGDVVGDARFVHADTLDAALKRLWARGALERARRPRRALRDLLAMFARDGRAVSVEVRELTEEEMAAVVVTEGHHKEYKDATLLKELKFERRMRVSASTGAMFHTAQARYEHAEKVLNTKSRVAAPKLPKRPRVAVDDVEEDVDEALFDEELAARRAEGEHGELVAEEDENLVFKLIFKMYLSYTPDIVGGVVDAALLALKPREADETDGEARERAFPKKALLALWQKMTKGETQLTFRTLVAFRRLTRQESAHNNARATGRVALLDNFCMHGGEETLDKKTAALTEIHKLDELLVACGWVGGVFAGADERVASFMEANNPRIDVPGNSGEKNRRAAAVHAVCKFEKCEVAAKNLMHTKVRTLVQEHGPFGLVVSADKTKVPTEWAVVRPGKLWGFVERVTHLEWDAFWAGDRVNGRGSYANDKKAKM